MRLEILNAMSITFETQCISVILKLRIVEDEEICKQICEIKKTFYEVAVCRITFCVKLKCQSILYIRFGLQKGKKTMKYKQNNTAANFVCEIF